MTDQADLAKMSNWQLSEAVRVAWSAAHTAGPRAEPQLHKEWERLLAEQTRRAGGE